MSKEKINRDTLNYIFDSNSLGLSEDINGEFYTIYNKREIIKAILDLFH